ncbi:hypothetical protein [Psychroflexus sp. ALD_RP9]|uniref:hypothetical protein n=1 Tax=Psychroflexus sp. ALD_RP9 TaxID=2777186 RepID=UPI001A8D920E|nr:hypothetical protein [Psychroflexus sp. ALD_RP9]QSS96607.1 hypothetical protein IMZ30_09155 [Psychroflexus sp. ALD_RP9]
MKIKLQLKPDTIIALDRLLEMLWDLPVSLDKRENVYKSIGYDLAEKFSSKAKSIIKKANLFETKTKAISLKYHEAWALEIIINELLEHFPDKNEYRKSLLTSLSNNLNQKLA